MVRFFEFNHGNAGESNGCNETTTPIFNGGIERHCLPAGTRGASGVDLANTVPLERQMDNAVRDQAREPYAGAADEFLNQHVACKSHSLINLLAKFFVGISVATEPMTRPGRLSTARNSDL